MPKCPNCLVPLTLEAQVPAEQTFTVELTGAVECFNARTIGESIINTEKSLKSIAREAGFGVEVFIKSIVTEPHKTTIIYFVVNSPKARKGINGRK